MKEESQKKKANLKMRKMQKIILPQKKVWAI